MSHRFLNFTTCNALSPPHLVHDIVAPPHPSLVHEPVGCLLPLQTFHYLVALQTKGKYRTMHQYISENK